jgi:alkanesulfonate monooxygenase SsuD/methylene tetrahydromethanopterin reductase-like flavin-dependent oxidoreductase (luciferase family)
MQFGLSVPPFADLSDVRLVAALAAEAEQVGWDGFFIWDHVLPWPTPVADPWVTLTAIALSTSRVRIGALVTPVPRRRPVKLAREAVTLDHLSGGRLILGVGSGGGPWEYEYLGDEPSPAVRAAMLDEALGLLAELWTGQPVFHTGRYYRFHGDGGPTDPTHGPTPFLPAPLQAPRIPIWVGGAWPRKRPFRRAARWDGVVPLSPRFDVGQYLTTAEVREIVAYVQSQRSIATPCEMVISGHNTGQDGQADRALAEAYADAGATWWLEDVSPWPFGWAWDGPWPIDAMRARITAGPPR